jgi:ABC-type branched-subunit amino acid transport system permease subunit
MRFLGRSQFAVVRHSGDHYRRIASKLAPTPFAAQSEGPHMNPTLDKFLGGKQGAIGLAVLATLILVVFPLALDAFRLNMVGKYLTYAFVAVGLVLCWGYGGILSLGQGVFFGLGGYCMAMFLKLEASDPESTKIQSTPGIPDFMDWNQITELPLLWQPFHSFGFTLLAVIAVPVILALVIGVAMFKRRVGDVYFSIVTQAIALILTVLIIGQQGLTGGVNGITDLKTLMGWDIRDDSSKMILYFVNAFLLLGAVWGALLVNYGKTYFSETFPELWLYLMDGLFIAVVMYFPNGIAGLWESHGRKWLGKLRRKPAPLADPAPQPETPAISNPPRKLETTP